MSINSNLVRAAFAAICLSTFVGAAPQPAQADPYRWCADYSTPAAAARTATS